ncbi:MAG: transglycosylase domain-containing protein, partial [Bacteroidota bacterium]
MNLSKIINAQNKYLKAFTRTLWILLFMGVVILPLYVYTVSLEWDIYGGLPSLKALENPENDLSSQLISGDGVSLGSYFRYNRSPVGFEDLSPELVKTLISSEDHRFYQHSGIDLRGLLRAAWGVI